MLGRRAACTTLPRLPAVGRVLLKPLAVCRRRGLPACSRASGRGASGEAPALAALGTAECRLAARKVVAVIMQRYLGRRKGGASAEAEWIDFTARQGRFEHLQLEQRERELQAQIGGAGGMWGTV